MREEKHRTQEHRSDNYAPLRKARPRAIYHPMGRGGGRSGGLKGQGHGNRTDSLQGGVWRPWWIRGFGRPWQDKELGRPWWDKELGRPWQDSLQGPQPPPRPLWLEPYYPTPPKKILGGSRGWFGLALWRRGHLGALWRRGHWRSGPWRNGHWRNGHWRSGHLRALARSGFWNWRVLRACVTGGRRAWGSRGRWRAWLPRGRRDWGSCERRRGFPHGQRAWGSHERRHGFPHGRRAWGSRGRRRGFPRGLR